MMTATRVGLFLLASVLSQRAIAAVEYDVLNLGTLGTETRGIDVNPSGEVTGFSKTTSNVFHAFLHDGSGMIDLGTLGGSESYGRAVNDLGQVVGNSLNTDGRNHAYRFTDTNGNGATDPGEMVDLGTLDGWTSVAYDVNASGQVAGHSQKKVTILQYDHAFRWTDTNGNNAADPGEMVDLGTLGGNTSYAYGMNDLGAVVGKSTWTASYNHAFYWFDTNDNNASDSGEMIDLGTLGGSTSQAWDVNDSAQVVGSAHDGTHTMAALWSDTGGDGLDPSDIVGLGDLGGNYSEALGINNSGIVVGQSWTGLPGDDGAHAFIYRDGGMEDLNSLIDPALGWILQEAWAINDSGQIAGFGKVSGEIGLRPFLLTPISAGPESHNLTIQSTAGTLDALAPSFIADSDPNSVHHAAVNTALDAGQDVLVSTDNTAASDFGLLQQASDATIVKSAGTTATLTLRSADDIVLEGGVIASQGVLHVALVANDASQAGHDADVDAGDVRVAAAINTPGGDFSSSGVHFDNTGGAVTAATVTIDHTGNTTIAAALQTGTLAITSGGLVQLTTSGRLQGAGNVTSSAGISNAGVVAPGSSAGTLTAGGDYVQESTGSLEIEIGGLAAGSEHDQLTVTGSADFAGTLSLSLIDPSGGSSVFDPVVTDTFTIMNYASRYGVFETVTGYAIDADRSFSLHYSDTELTLIAGQWAAGPGDELAGVFDVPEDLLVHGDWDWSGLMVKRGAGILAIDLSDGYSTTQDAALAIVDGTVRFDGNGTLELDGLTFGDLGALSGDASLAGVAGWYATPVAVPEPATVVLVVTALLAVFLWKVATCHRFRCQRVCVTPR